MEYEYLKYPRSVVALSEEIKRVVNDYDARRIGNDEVKDIILWYANTCPQKLYQGQGYNKSVKKLIGKRRTELLDAVLKEYKTSF